MKFKNIGSVSKVAYGYTFGVGEVVEVVEDSLANKFGNYDWLEEVSDAVQGKRKEEPREEPGEEKVLSRAELKARADELGIEYAPQTRTATLAKLVAEHG